LIFTNTRSQAEIWYQRILEIEPDLAGIIAMHHGSIRKDIRGWVEDALYDGRLKAVVCTSSLDLGVDFRPVETIIQIGSPKGVARFMQRAGRSGHAPGETSKIYFVPTHALELIEAASLREAINQNIVESRLPYIRSFDVLLQYLITLAVADGFDEQQIYEEITQTRSFDSVTMDEWKWCLHFLVNGGNQLSGYEEFHKVVITEEGLYKVESRKIAMRHRLSIGTIVSDQMLQVRLSRGGYLGSVEEYFASKLKPGDVFWFAGQNLQFVKMKGLTVEVQRTSKTKGLVPSYSGGRMPLSAEMGAMLRIQLNKSLAEKDSPELQMIAPLIELQEYMSIVPNTETLLIERLESDEGHHIFVFPFEGRLVHEGLAALLAYRLSLFQPISFTIAMNDYGFELLSDSEIPIEDAIDSDIFSETDMMEDIIQSINETEMARKRFRDVARIAGLTFAGFPGKLVKDKHLQANSQLFFEVFNEYEPNNLLLKEAHEEVREFQLEEARMRNALHRINKQKIKIADIQKPTPLAFPILVDRLNNVSLSSESMADRIRKILEL
jgi:ATP-dependent Lhr-like helicase